MGSKWERPSTGFVSYNFFTKAFLRPFWNFSLKVFDEKTKEKKSRIPRFRNVFNMRNETLLFYVIFRGLETILFSGLYLKPSYFYLSFMPNYIIEKSWKTSLHSCVVQFFFNFLSSWNRIKINKSRNPNF